MNLNKISETSTTITLGWTPPSGVQYYLFYANNKLVSNSPAVDKNGAVKNSIKFSKDGNPFEAVAVLRQNGTMSFDIGKYDLSPTPPPPPPPPPPTGDALFDGRATLIDSMRGCTYGTTTGAYMNPKIYTDGIGTYYEDDFTLVSDPRFQKVFRIRLNQKSRNPYWVGQPSTKPSAEVTVRRPITLGQVDWYALSYKFQSGWKAGDWGVITQLGYPTLASPPLAVAISGSSSPRIGIDRHAGYVTSGTTGLHNEEPRFHNLSDVQDKWLDFVIGVKWTVDNTGWVHVETRLPGQAWIVKYDMQNTPTWQVKSGDSPKATVMDKIGAYQDASDLGTFENVVFNRGLMRFADRNSAIASLG